MVKDGGDIMKELIDQAGEEQKCHCGVSDDIIQRWK